MADTATAIVAAAAAAKLRTPQDILEAMKAVSTAHMRLDGQRLTDIFIPLAR